MLNIAKGRYLDSHSVRDISKSESSKSYSIVSIPASVLVSVSISALKEDKASRGSSRGVISIAVAGAVSIE